MLTDITKHALAIVAKHALLYLPSAEFISGIQARRGRFSETHLKAWVRRPQRMRLRVRSIPMFHPASNGVGDDVLPPKAGRSHAFSDRHGGRDLCGRKRRGGRGGRCREVEWTTIRR